MKYLKSVITEINENDYKSSHKVVVTSIGFEGKTKTIVNELISPKNIDANLKIGQEVTICEHPTNPCPANNHFVVVKNDLTGMHEQLFRLDNIYYLFKTDISLIDEQHYLIFKKNEILTLPHLYNNKCGEELEKAILSTYLLEKQKSNYLLSASRSISRENVTISNNKWDMPAPISKAQQFAYINLQDAYTPIFNNHEEIDVKSILAFTRSKVTKNMNNYMCVCENIVKNYQPKNYEKEL